MPPKILIFAPYFSPSGFTESNPEAIVNRKLALTMLDAGWQVDVIARNIIIDGQSVKATAWNSPWERLEKITHEIPYFMGMSRHVSGSLKLLSNALRYGYFVSGNGIVDKELRLAHELHVKNKYDVIISRSVPDPAHLPALIFHNKTGIPWIANFNDPTSSRLPYPFNVKLPPVSLMLQNIFLKDVAARASALSFPSKRMKDYITGYLGQNSGGKSYVIPHVTYDFIARPAKTNNSVFTIGYAGGLDKKYRSPETFFNGLSSFIDKYGLRNKVKVRIFGNYKQDIFSIPASKGFLNNEIELKGCLGYMETISELSKCDLTLIIEGPFKEGIFLPSKLSDYVMIGRPILSVSPKISVMNDILSLNGGGISADCLSAEEISSALEKLYLSWRQNTLDELYGSAKLNRLFSKESVIRNYCGIFSRLNIQSL